VWTAKLEKFAAMIEKVPLDQIGQSAAALLEDVRHIVESKDTGDLLPNANAAIADARTLLHRIDGQIEPLMASVKGTLTHADSALDGVRTLALDVDSRVDPLVTQANAALRAAQSAPETGQATLGDARPLIAEVRGVVGKLDAQADPLLSSFRSTSDSARSALERAQFTLRGVDRTLDQESPLGFELYETLSEFRGAAQALRSLLDYLERVPDAPIYGVRRPRGQPK
jgi:hypothetical protein